MKWSLDIADSKRRVGKEIERDIFSPCDRRTTRQADITGGEETWFRMEESGVDRHVRSCGEAWHAQIVKTGTRPLLSQ